MTDVTTYSILRPCAARIMFGTIPSRGVLTSDAQFSGKISYGGKPGKGEPVSPADDCSAREAAACARDGVVHEGASSASEGDGSDGAETVIRMDSR